MNRPPLTVWGALESGCRVDAVCSDCQNIRRLDLAKLADEGRADVPLIELPLRCICGSKRSRIIVSDQRQDI
jgi:hypothetical protein